MTCSRCRQETPVLVGANDLCWRCAFPRPLTSPLNGRPPISESTDQGERLRRS